MTTPVWHHTIVVPALVTVLLAAVALLVVVLRPVVGRWLLGLSERIGRQ